MPKKLTIESAKILADIHNGQCSSELYINNHSDLEWVCEKGHTFSKPLKRVKKGEWCPYCSGKYVSFTPSELNDYASGFGGKCLSDSPRKISDYARWECSDGHQWDAIVFNVIKNKSWCPECNSFIGEEVARFIIEQLTGHKFPKKRPDWLKANSSRSMELDGYCQELSTAFEHQGRHHYANNRSIFNDGEVLIRDNLKRELCKQHDVNLIEIPEIGNLSDIGGAIGIIKKSLETSGIINFKKINEDFVTAKIPSLYNKHVETLNKIAESKGGKCISTKYLGHVIPLEFECAKGHRWYARPNDVKRGSWCSVCSRAGGKKKSIAQISSLMTPYGIKCTSKEYFNSKHTYEWECSKGHKFSCRYDYLLASKRCPKCSGK